MISGLPPSLLVESGTKNGRGLPWVVRITEKPWMRYPSLVGLAGTEESVLIWGGVVRIALLGWLVLEQEGLANRVPPRMRLEGTSGN